MYSRFLSKASETRTFIVCDAGTSGWEVRDLKNTTVIKHARYDDWHRVERAMASFATEAMMLREAGWVES